MIYAKFCACGDHAFREFSRFAIVGLVDAEDIAILNERWHPDKYQRSNCVRLQRSSNGKTQKLHHAVLPGVKPIDHINRNAADNRKSNLRATTPRDNVLNTKNRKDWKYPTGVRGVYMQFRGGKIHYCARIHADGRPIHLGYFDTIEAASIARQEAAIKCYGVIPGVAQHGEVMPS